MSLHHIKFVHGSNVNTSAKPRIGIAVRYITPDVISEGSEREKAILVRGKDALGNFELLDPPKNDMVWNGEIPEIIRSKMKNLMPKDFALPVPEATHGHKGSTLRRGRPLPLRVLRLKI